MNLKQKIGNEILFFDGAMGTMLQTRCPDLTEHPENSNISHPEQLIAIHEDYVRAGSNIITTNTLGAFSIKYNNADDLIQAGIKNAKTAIQNIGRADCYVALDLGPTGKLLEPLGDLPFETCYQIYKEAVLSGEKYGADLIILETMVDVYETKAAILAAKENTKLPVLVTMTFDANGRTMTGCDLQTMVSVLESLGVDAVGMNCGLGSEVMKKLVPRLLAEASIPVLIQPNAGMPQIENGITKYESTPDDFANAMKEMCGLGVWLVGGCCGTTPEHIHKSIELCKTLHLDPVVDKKITTVSSATKTVAIHANISIGYDMDADKDADLSKALQSEDWEYLVDCVLDQETDIINLKLQTDGITESECIQPAIAAIQEISNVPLSIQTTDPKTAEYALRYYNGKCMLNITQTNERKQFYPLVKKYGGTLICSTQPNADDIPENHLQEATKIFTEITDHTINAKHICITVPIEDEKIKQTVEQSIKETLGFQTIR